MPTLIRRFFPLLVIYLLSSAAAWPMAADTVLQKVAGDPVPPYAKYFDPGVMGPPATPAIVSAALAAVKNPLPPGPFKPNWNSIRRNYQPPAWFENAKFGLFMHWGLYSVPAHHNEWYEKHMYAGGADTRWHTEHYGPPDKFGYKDFIPLFKAAKWDPNRWAKLFKDSGAKYVIPTAEHHDGFLSGTAL